MVTEIFLRKCYCELYMQRLVALTNTKEDGIFSNPVLLTEELQPLIQFRTKNYLHDKT